MATNAIRQIEVRYSQSGQREVVRDLNAVATESSKAASTVTREVQRMGQTVARVTVDASTGLRSFDRTAHQMADNVSASGLKVEKAYISQVRQIQALQKQLDPLYREQMKIAAQEERIAAAVANRTISFERGNELLNLSAARYNKLAKEAIGANDNVQLTANQVGNLGYQLNDIVSGLAMGQSPFMIMTQQSGQVVQALSEGPGGVRGSLKAMGAQLVGLAASIGPVGLALGAATLAVGAFAYAFRKDFPDLERTLEKHEDLIGRIADQYDGLQGKLDRMARTSVGIGLNIEAGALARDLETLIDREMRSLDLDFTSYIGQALFGAFDTANAPTRAAFATIQGTVDEFRARLKDGTADVDAFRQTLADMYRQASETGEPRCKRRSRWPSATRTASPASSGKRTKPALRSKR